MRAGGSRADCAFGDDAAFAAIAPGWWLLDHVTALWHPHLERRVVEVTAISRFEPRATASTTFPFSRAEWPPAPSGSQYRSMPALGGEEAMALPASRRSL